MSLQDSATRMLSRLGADYTVWRQTRADGSKAWESAAPVDAFYPCRARGRGYDPRKSIGTLADNESLMIVDASTLEVTPKKGDKIAKGRFTSNQAGAVWQQITAVYNPEAGEARPVYRLRVTG